MYVLYVYTHTHYIPVYTCVCLYARMHVCMHVPGKRSATHWEYRATIFASFGGAYSKRYLLWGQQAQVWPSEVKCGRQAHVPVTALPPPHGFKTLTTIT